MRSDDVYEEDRDPMVGDERGRRETDQDGDDLMVREGQLNPDDQLARDDQMTEHDQTARDEQDEQMTRNEQLARDDQMTRDDDQLDRDEVQTQAEQPTTAPRGTMPAGGDGADATFEPFGEGEVDRFRGEWREIQAKFVDDPQEAVRGADNLVSEVMDSLTSTFNNHKHELESQWQQGDDAQTEDLRQALRRYRTFFDQLLNA